MASHHHHHHCQDALQLPPLTTTGTCCCYNNCCPQPHHPSIPPPPPQLPVDSLIQSLASLLQQQPNLYSFYPERSNSHKSRHRKLRLQPENLDFLPQDRNEQAFSSLLQRINALESSLHHFSTSSAECSRHLPSSYSLRDIAARVIQTHFRAFLVRRSRTLRQLKDLAFVKSRFNSLKSSISGKTHFNFEIVAHKTMDLLVKVDSIQGGDPMIRDGKRSISRDLTKFLEFIDELAVKRHGISYKSAKNVRLVRKSNSTRVLNPNNGYGDLRGYQKQIVQKLRGRTEKNGGFSRVYESDEEDVELEGFQQVISEDEEEEDNLKICVNGKNEVPKFRNVSLLKRHDGQPRVKKTVSFAENGNVYRVYGDNHESVLNGDGSFTYGSDSSDDRGEAMKNHFSEVEERKGFSKGTGNEEAAGNGGSTHNGSDGERIIEYYQDQDGNSVFSAPVPVKMETRADLLNNRKGVKIVT